MEDEELAESLLVAPQPGNIRIISNGVGSNDIGASGVTAVLLLSAFVTACSAFAGGFVAGYSAPAESGIIADLGLSVAEYSVFGSIMTIGGMVGAVISGKLADIIGRKYTMWILDIFYIMGWLAIYFAKGAWLLDLGRLSLGFGFGLTCYVAPTYLSEITPKNLRGGITSVSMAMIPVGVSVAYLIGSVINWRALALIGAIPCLLLLFGLFFIPESPRWLVSVTGECLGCFLTGLSFVLQNLNWWMEATPTLMLSGIVVFEVSYSLGIGSIPWIIISEISPINIKGSAGSICNAVNWFCTWLVSFTFNFLVEWSPAGTFFIYGSMSCLGVLFIAKLVPETKGRTLEEIQASLTHILQ